MSKRKHYQQAKEYSMFTFQRSKLSWGNAFNEFSLVLGIQ